MYKKVIQNRDKCFIKNDSHQSPCACVQDIARKVTSGEMAGL